jgi:formamidase
MTQTLIKVDLSKPPQTQEVLHNRWHPDIPMIAYVKPGDEFRVECVDWTGGQIANDDVANDPGESYQGWSQQVWNYKSDLSA